MTSVGSGLLMIVLPCSSTLPADLGAMTQLVRTDLTQAVPLTAAAAALVRADLRHEVEFAV